MKNQPKMCLNTKIFFEDLEKENINPKIEAIFKRAKQGEYDKKPKQFLMAHLQAAKLSTMLENCKKGKYDG